MAAFGAVVLGTILGLGAYAATLTALRAPELAVMRSLTRSGRPVVSTPE